MSSGSLVRRRRIDDHMILIKNEVVQGHNAYKVDRLVGAGAYAAVYRAVDELGRTVALKEYFPAPHPRDAQQLRTLWEREKYVLTQVSPHPLMPSFYDAFEYNKQLYIAQEFVEGSTLAEIIQRYKKLDRDWMLKWAVNLCDALTFLHERCIVHHDLKPANLKITPEGHLFLLDYGAAQFFGDERDDIPEAFTTDNELYGTEGYLPPELEDTFVADVQTDIFALGCILYEMVMGVPPEQQRINERNMAVTTPLTRRRDIDLDYVKLVSTALSYNTEYRYASAQVFLQELRKISPPVPMVSHKNLYFGTVNWKEEEVNQRFLIYNAGPQVELIGEMGTKAPWLKIETPRFRGKRREVVVTCLPQRVPAVNKPLNAEIEILFNEQRDTEGRVTSRADRWIVNCYLYVPAKAAKLEIADKQPMPLVVRAARGLTGKLQVQLINSGEVPAEFVFVARDPSLGVTVNPSKLQIAGSGSGQIEIQFRPTQDVNAGMSSAEIVATVNDEEVASFPIALQLLSPFEYAKAALGLGR